MRSSPALAPRLPNPLPALSPLAGLPVDVFGALRRLPEIAESTRAMREHTAVLGDVLAVLERVSSHTAALPAVREELAAVVAATTDMDTRLTSVEAAMPALLQVRADLERLPVTLEALDTRMGGLSAVLDRLMVTLGELGSSVDTLGVGVQPLSRLAKRMPGGGRDREP